MLGPSIGGLELLVVALLALIVVGPKDLPVLMRKVGQFLNRARKMASEFRASFDDMARQSELDDLRKEVEALRSGQMMPLGKEASSTFKDIDAELKAPPPPKPLPAPKSAADQDNEDAIIQAKLEAASKVAPEEPVEIEPEGPAAAPPKPRATRRKAKA